MWGYAGIGDGLWGIKVPEDEAYEYAKTHLDDLDEHDRKLFVDFFFSGCWVKEEWDDQEL